MSGKRFAGQNRFLTFSAGQMSDVRRYFKACIRCMYPELPLFCICILLKYSVGPVIFGITNSGARGISAGRKLACSQSRLVVSRYV